MGKAAEGEAKGGIVPVRLTADDQGQLRRQRTLTI
jgi:hypothetical protein